MRRTMKQKECTVNDVGSAIKILFNTTYRQGFIEKVNWISDEKIDKTKE